MKLNREETCKACPNVKDRQSVQNCGDMREHLQFDYRDDIFITEMDVRQ